MFSKKKKTLKDNERNLSQNVAFSIGGRKMARKNYNKTTPVESNAVPALAPDEARSKRVQILIKPSTNEKLDALVSNGKIKSKNDLINYLLEDFLKSESSGELEVADGIIRLDGQFKGQLSFEDM